MQTERQRLVNELQDSKKQRSLLRRKLDKLESISTTRPQSESDPDRTLEIKNLRTQLEGVRSQIHVLERRLAELDDSPEVPDEQHQEEYDQQLKILQAHRRTLAHHLEQSAKFSAGYVPAHIAIGIQEAREQIAQIKRTIRGWGYSVDDNLIDQESVEGLDTINQATLKIPPSLTLDSVQSWIKDILNRKSLSFRILLFILIFVPLFVSVGVGVTLITNLGLSPEAFIAWVIAIISGATLIAIEKAISRSKKP